MISCIVCEEVYTAQGRPMVLPCGHSFCSQCTQQCHECPLCRSSYDPTRVPINYLAHSLIQTLTTIHSLNQTPQILQQLQEDEKQDKVVHLCGTCENFANVSCTQCSAFLCDSCDAFIHKPPGNRTHNRKSCLEKEEFTMKTCYKHPHRDVELYCRQDKELICLECHSEFFNGSHSGHVCVALNEAAEEIGDVVKSKICSSRELLDSCAKDISQIQQNVHELMDKATTIHEDYITTSAHMLNELERRKKITLKYLIFLNTLNQEEEKDCMEQLTMLRRLQDYSEEFDEVFDSAPKEFGLLSEISRRLYKDTEKLLQLTSFPDVSLNQSPCISGVSLILKHSHWKTLQRLFGDHFARWKLLFQTARDGFSASKFHQTCNGKANTLVIVQANGYIFGGFTPLYWNGSGNYVGGIGESWIFSLTNPQNFPVKMSCTNNTYEIRGHPNMGPTFGGGHDFYISDNCDSNRKSYTNLGHSYDTSSIPSFNGQTFLVGEYNFAVQSYEVYTLEI